MTSIHGRSPTIPLKKRPRLCPLRIWTTKPRCRCTTGMTRRVTSDFGFYYYNASRKRSFVSCFQPIRSVLHGSWKRLHLVVPINYLPQRYESFPRSVTIDDACFGTGKNLANQQGINNLPLLMNKCSRSTAKDLWLRSAVAGATMHSIADEGWTLSSSPVLYLTRGDSLKTVK